MPMPLKTLQYPANWPQIVPLFPRTALLLLAAEAPFPYG
jgi:hypothetical protein